MDEVLVHISTAATRENDELFRSLANAYNAFQPFQVYHNEPVRKRARLIQPTRLDPNADLSRIGDSTTGDTVDPLVLTGSKDSYGSFPSNISSQEQHQNQNPAAIDGSMRMISHLAQPDNSDLSWRKCTPPRSSFTCSQRELQNSPADLQDADTGFIENSLLVAQVFESQQVDTYSMTFADASGGESTQDEITIDPKNWSPHNTKPVRKKQSELLEEVQLPAALKKGASADLEDSLLAEPLDCLIHETQAFEREDHACTDQPNFSALPINAFAPPPTISVACPDILPSQVTKHLAAIKTKNPNRFKPLRTLRKLDVDERGYWLVDCVKWTPEIQWDFWSLLYDHVSYGRIGWGTTLHRETESDYTLGCVRLYSWGEVAEHTWLLLWLCSKGKVCGVGTKWFDANGTAVLEVT